MPVDVTLPQWGESPSEGTIGRWLKQPGDRVERCEPLVEIITDKVNVEMPAPYGGVLARILIPEGQTVPVGTPIAVMETSDAAVQSPAAARPTPDAPGVGMREDRTQLAEAERGRLSPVVRRRAEGHGLPPGGVGRLQGSGAGGRVTKEDVLKYVETRHGAPPLAPAATMPPSRPV